MAEEEKKEKEEEKEVVTYNIKPHDCVVKVKFEFTINKED